MHLPNEPARYLFFTGKGGVGKATLACATAIALADASKTIQLVSTDAASNHNEMLGVILQMMWMTARRLGGTKPPPIFRWSARAQAFSLDTNIGNRLLERT